MKVIDLLGTNDGYQLKVVDVTPALAAEMLKRLHPNQRFANERHVKLLAAAQTAGKWVANAQPILFDELGRLVDGQHRLKACVVSGRTLQRTLVGTVSGTTLSSIDTNRKARTAVDVAQMIGPSTTVRPNSSVITGLAMEAADFNLQRYQAIDVPGKARMYNSYCECDALGGSPMEQLLPVVNAARRNRLCSPSSIGMVIRVGREDVEAFGFFESAFANTINNSSQSQLLHNTLVRLQQKRADQRHVLGVAWSMLRAYVAWTRDENMLLIRPPPLIEQTDLTVKAAAASSRVRTDR